MGRTGDLGSAMGLDNDWAARVVAQVGNFGEAWERNITPIGVPRGVNAFWTRRRLHTRRRCAEAGRSSGGGAPRLQRVDVGTAVGQRGQFRPQPPLPLQVQVGHDHAHVVGRAGQHRAPRVDDHAAAVARLAGHGLAELAGADHEAPILHGPRAEQQLPTVAAGVEGEGRRDEQQPRARQRVQTVQLGEADVFVEFIRFEVGEFEAGPVGGSRPPRAFARGRRFQAKGARARAISSAVLDTPGSPIQASKGWVASVPSTWPLPARRSVISTSPVLWTVSAATQAKGTPAAMARPAMPSASRGLVANRTPSDTCAAAERAGSLTRSFGR